MAYGRTYVGISVTQIEREEVFVVVAAATKPAAAALIRKNVLNMAVVQGNATAIGENESSQERLAESIEEKKAQHLQIFIAWEAWMMQTGGQRGSDGKLKGE
jgi:hypothetical protein